MGRHLVRGKVKERAYGGQSKIARARADAPRRFKLVQKGGDERRIDFFKCQVIRRDMQPLVRKAQQESEGVAIRADGVRADPLLLHQALREEPLQQRREARYRRSPGIRKNGAIALRSPNTAATAAIPPSTSASALRAVMRWNVNGWELLCVPMECPAACIRRTVSGEALAIRPTCSKLHSARQRAPLELRRERPIPLVDQHVDLPTATAPRSLSLFRPPFAFRRVAKIRRPH